MKTQAVNTGIRKCLKEINDFLSVLGESATVENLGNGETVTVKMIVMSHSVLTSLFETAKKFGLSSHVSVSMDGRNVEFKAFV